MSFDQRAAGQNSTQASTNKNMEQCRRGCPVCGGELIDIKMKTVCSRCHTICETCCEGGRG